MDEVQRIGMSILTTATKKPDQEAKRSIRDINQSQEAVKQFAKMFETLGNAFLVAPFAPFIISHFAEIELQINSGGGKVVASAPVASVPVAPATVHTTPMVFGACFFVWLAFHILAIRIMKNVDKMNLEKELLKEGK